MADKGFDEGVILRIARKDRDAFAELYRMESDAVYGLALSILRNKEDAEDVMHDAFIRIFNAAGSYSPGGEPLAWIFTIVRNLCYNKIRDSEKTRDEEPAKFENEEQAGTTEGCGNDIEEATDRMVLDAAMECLEQDEREIVILHALTGLRHREIAEALDMPEGTVLSKYNRALKKMRKALGE